MPRQPRKSFPNTQYHIIARGNRKTRIFSTFDDYNVYLILLSQTKKRHPFKLISYCLMPNHIHLQIHTQETPLPEIMKLFHQKYALYYNKKYNLVGHMFQGRYKSIPIQTIESSLYVSRYIHLNPVKAQMVRRPEQYEWSSYNGYLYPGINKLLDHQLLLDHFHSNKAFQQYTYAKLPTKTQDVPRTGQSRPNVI